MGSFLEAHALRALKAEPTWTLTMYCVYNDLSDATCEELRKALRGKLPAAQLR